MQDRIPTPGQEGRVLITPENGSPAYHAKVEMADNPSQAGTPLNKVTLLKDATAALYGLGTDAVPDDVFKVLSQAALYKTVTHTAQLGTLTEGSIIYLNENGQPVPFYVAKQGYEPDYNTNRVLVVRKDVYSNMAWDAGNVNAYATSDIDAWFNSAYKNLLDPDIQTAIGATQFPYTPGNGNNTVSTLARSIFALSLTELGESKSSANVEGSALPIASMLKIAYLNGNANDQYTRSPTTNSTKYAWRLNLAGLSSGSDCNIAEGSRPAFTLPSTFIATTGDPTTGLYDLSNNLLLTLPGVQIETGSYTGTGTNGSGNKNILTFNIDSPKMVLVYRNATFAANNGAWQDGFVWAQGITQVSVINSLGNSSGSVYFSQSEKSLSWYSTTNATVQLNASGIRYYYFAIC